MPLGSAAMLLPAPLTSSASGRDPTAWMDDAMTPPGVSRIGLAHGSVRGFGSEAHASQQIAPSRAQTAGLAYLALGDWHGALSVSDRVWYSGTPEPDRYPENEPGYVIVVQIGDGGDTREPPVKVERVRVAHFVWSEQHAVLEQASDWDRIAAGITDGATAGVPADRQLLKLVLSGAVTLTERTRIEAGIAQIEPAYFHFETNLDALHERSDDDDLCGLSDSGARDIAARLRGMIAARDGKDAASGEVAPGASPGVARHALRKLMRLDAQLACGPADGRDAREAP